MSKYQITLTPVDKFFFGGDMTFQVGNNEKLNSQFKSYIIESLMFPQQTSLLGMLRFLILRNAGRDVFNNDKIVNQTKANALIGERSFMVGAENDFKTIKKLSHVRIRRTDDKKTSDLEFAPLYKELTFNNATYGTYNLNDITIPKLDDYEAKKGLEVMLTDGEKKYKLEDIFVKDRRVGINRDIDTGIVNDSALFKQVSYRFNNKDAKHCFAFDAEIDESVPFESYNGQVVSVGADNSQFVIGITKDVKKTIGFAPYKNAVCLLSPTSLRRDEAKKAIFAITRLMSFRFLTDRKDNRADDKRTYHILNSKLERSKRYELYAPGSVFYFDDDSKKQEFIKIIESKEEFRQIGYNEFK
ncbi:MAG: hypothetical protein J5905_05445 [Prevotella sp.]|nr:hypothetical protein [Prevotella sp.]